MTDTQSSERIPGTNWTPRAYRNLKIAVVVMGVLLVVGFAVVFGTIIARLASSGERPAHAPVTVEAGAEVARLLGPDSEVVSTNVDSNRLALVVRRPDGLGLLIVDLRSGEVIAALSGGAAESTIGNDQE
jgi:hypothetical protein